MKIRLFIMLSTLLLTCSIQAQTLIQNEDGTFRIETIKTRPNGEKLTRLSPKRDSVEIVSYIYTNLFRSYDQEATRIKQLEMQEKERKAWNRVMNNDLGVNYFDLTALEFAPRLSGEWRIKVDTLRENCDLELTNQKNLRLRGQGLISIIETGVRLNIRVNMKSEKQLVLKNLLGADVDVFDADLLNFDAENEEEEEVTGTRDRRKYVGRHPITNARIVLLKLKDVSNENE